jgi:ribosomal protein S18 acetylase RimI-like enzyme
VLEGTSAAYVLRPAQGEDRDWLFSVYASTRAEELGGVPWTPEQKAAFLRQQFEAQDQYYREQYPGAAFFVIEASGATAGRLYVARWPREIRIMDIALLPAHRGQGLGTAILKDLLAEGDATGKTVSIHVERQNPALGLYERLGFELAVDRGVYLFLERPASPAGGEGPRPTVTT